MNYALTEIMQYKIHVLDVQVFKDTCAGVDWVGSDGLDHALNLLLGLLHNTTYLTMIIIDYYKCRELYH